MKLDGSALPMSTCRHVYPQKQGGGTECLTSLKNATHACATLLKSKSKDFVGELTLLALFLP